MSASADLFDEGKNTGLGIEWLTGQHWTRIGSITFTEAAASYNGDFVIHFTLQCGVTTATTLAASHAGNSGLRT